MACLKPQLERWLKEVDVKMYEAIQMFEALKVSMGVIAVISHQPAHY